MKRKLQVPDVVDFAYQIIDIHREIAHLKNQVKHYKGMCEMLQKGQSDSINHNKKMIGMVLSAAIDPNSNLNKPRKVGKQ